MTNVSGLLKEELWSEKHKKCDLTQCAGPCAETAFLWLIVGAYGFPYLAKRGLQRYLSFETRFLIAGVSAVITSFYMGYRSKANCEENIIRLYAKRNQKSLEDQREFKNKKNDIEKGLLKEEES